MLLQNGSGAAPGGFVAVEFQEWFRLRVLPAIQAAARLNFSERNRQDWFKWHVYQELCSAVGHVHTGIEPFFFFSCDSDPRHSLKYYWLKIDDPCFKGKLPERTDIPKGQPGHIPFDPDRNRPPHAPRVPDAIQYPVESLFASVKRRYYSIISEIDDVTPAAMVSTIERAFREVATPDIIRNCFEHGEVNMKIFAGEEGDTVRVGPKLYKCTDGGWLPRDRRA